jgi:hypothetical protein
VAVRALEGPSYGVLTLASTSGERLAQGELVQRLRNENVESRLTFHFEDGSFYDELLVFSQRKVFRLLSYSMTQRGPSFPSSLEVSFDRESGRYHARTRQRDDEKTVEGEVEMPEDLYNGMASLLIRNTDGHATRHHLAFTPKPQLLDLESKQAGVDRFSIGALERTATRYPRASTSTPTGS